MHSSVVACYPSIYSTLYGEGHPIIATSSDTFTTTQLSVAAMLDVIAARDATRDDTRRRSGIGRRSSARAPSVRDVTRNYVCHLLHTAAVSRPADYVVFEGGTVVRIDPSIPPIESPSEFVRAFMQYPAMQRRVTTEGSNGPLQRHVTASGASGASDAPERLAPPYALLLSVYERVRCIDDAMGGAIGRAVRYLLSFGFPFPGSASARYTFTIPTHVITPTPQRYGVTMPVPSGSEELVQSAVSKKDPREFDELLDTLPITLSATESSGDSPHELIAALTRSGMSGRRDDALLPIPTEYIDRRGVVAGL